MPSFFYRKRILVTGHTGFKGSWLCQMLLQMGAEVSGYALPVQEGLFPILRLQDSVDSSFADIRDRAGVERVLREKKPEIIFHLAAQPLVRQAYLEPAETYETNVMGTVNVLEAARKAGCVRSIVNVTTDKVYDNREWEWGYRETDPLGGNDPYSNSKACSELVTAAYVKSFFKKEGTRISTARAGNVLGGGDFAKDRIISDCVRAAAAGNEIQVRSPNAVRPYQYVLEALYGYLLIAQKQWDDPDVSGSYNIGPPASDCLPTETLVNLFCRLWGDGARWIARVPEFAPKESTFLRLDNAKIGRTLGWRPAVDIEETMERTVAWYRRYFHGEDMRAYTQREIENYCSRREQDVQPGAGASKDIGACACILGA